MWRYCGGRLDAAAAVNHFVPWSRYPVDFGHNFVLSQPTLAWSEWAAKRWCRWTLDGGPSWKSLRKCATMPSRQRR